MNPEPTPGPAPVRPFLPPLLVGLATLAAFLPALGGQFLNWDDNLNFTENPYYRGFSAENVTWMLTSGHTGHFHPLTWFTLALDYSLWGMNPAGYHLTSILIHAGSAVLLYFVILAFLRLSGRPELRWPAAVGALVYSLHPLRVESVAWITERRDVLCGFFLLLSVLAYLRRVEEERKGAPSGRWLALSLAAFGASLLSKALGIMLPAVLLFIDIHPLGRFTPGRRGRILVEKVWFGLLSVADAALMFRAMHQLETVRSMASYSVVERAAQAAYGLCFYPIKTLWPHPLQPIYPMDIVMNPAAPVYLGAMAAVAGVTALLVWRRRSWPGALTAWLAYGALVFPVLGVAVTGMQIAADRYSYLALLPLSVLIAAGLPRAAAGARLRVVQAASGLLLAGLAVLTARQCLVWKDSISLWNHEIRHEPGSYFAWYARGTLRMSQGDADGAIDDLNASITLLPWSVALIDRGVAKANQGDHAGAVLDFTRAIPLDPHPVTALTSRAISRSKLGDLDGALADCDQAARLDPASPVPSMVRSIIRSESGDLQGAIDDCTRALERDPQSPQLYQGRGQAHFKAGHYAEAGADYTKALQLGPRSPDLLANRGLARSMARDINGALADFSEALHLRPDALTFLRRATVRGMKGDLEGAILDLGEAVRLNPRYADAYVRRGVARMERGDAARAGEDFAKALEVAPPGWPQRAQAEEFLKRVRPAPPK